ncbi:MAG: DUF6174 domain-containing protein [Gemmatimonadaceae bacterium]
MSRSLSPLRNSALAILFLAAITACDGIVGLDGLGHEQRNLERARDRWRAANVYEYEITVDRRCECLYTGAIRMLVRSGVPVAAVDRFSGFPVAGHVLRYYPSVEELFDLIDDALYGSADDVDVSYDGVYGYPRLTSIDYSRAYVDDELHFDMREFRRLR